MTDHADTIPASVASSVGRPVSQLTVLGGGPAGLATGHFARKQGLPFTIFEASPRAGGNATTFQEGPFRFDSGAHRFHDRDSGHDEGGSEPPRSRPARVLHSKPDSSRRPVGRFPAIAVELAHRARAGGVRARGGQPASRAPCPDEGAGQLRGVRVSNWYGADIARRFLLGYSEKLWGLPCRQLSPAISGGARLDGLSFILFFAQAIRRSTNGSAHLDQRLYYPRYGFGQIADKLIEPTDRTGADQRTRDAHPPRRRAHSGGRNQRQPATPGGTRSSAPSRCR